MRSRWMADIDIDSGIVPPRTRRLKKDLATCIESVPRGALCILHCIVRTLCL